MWEHCDKNHNTLLFQLGQIAKGCEKNRICMTKLLWFPDRIKNTSSLEEMLVLDIFEYWEDIFQYWKNVSPPKQSKGAPVLCMFLWPKKVLSH